MKKRLTALAIVLALVLTLTACGGNYTAGTESTVSPESAAPETESTPAPDAAVTESAVVADSAGTLSVSLVANPEKLDPAIIPSTDEGTLLLHLFSGLARWEEDDNGNLIIVPDAAVELPEGVHNDDGAAT